MENKGKSNHEQLGELGIVTWERYQVTDPEQIEKLKKMGAKAKK